MNTETNEKLQFDRIKLAVEDRALGNYSKERIAQSQPQTNLATVRVWRQETQEARWILENGQHVPFMGLVQIDRLFAQIKRGLV